MAPEDSYCQTSGKNKYENKLDKMKKHLCLDIKYLVVVLTHN